jgi:hypothetical protein
LAIILLILLAPFVVAWVKILQKAGYSGWWVLIGLVPIVNLVMFLVFAFSRWPAVQRNRNATSALPPHPGYPPYGPPPVEPYGPPAFEWHPGQGAGSFWPNWTQFAATPVGSLPQPAATSSGRGQVPAASWQPGAAWQQAAPWQPGAPWLCGPACPAQHQLAPDRACIPFDDDIFLRAARHPSGRPPYGRG